MAIEQVTQLDTTRSWADQFRDASGELKPNLLVRYATDTNYLRGYQLGQLGAAKGTGAMMNLALPGQRVPNPIQWQVTEASTELTQQGSLTLLNAMPVSKTQTTLSGGLSGAATSPTIRSQWTQALVDNMIVKRYDGNFPITHFNRAYSQQDVIYTLYDYQTFSLTSTTGFPNPAVCNDDDNDVADMSAFFYSANDGVGAYFILVDDEIIRVCNLSGSTFYIPPGGRGIAGTSVVAHSAGATVKLLNYGPYTGDWVGMGWMNIDDYAPQTSLMRIGTCLVTYEGYGNFAGPMSHDVNHGRNYAFTGYWFVTGSEPAMQTDGTPTITLTLSSAGHMLESQKTSPLLLARMGAQLDQWTVGESGSQIWGLADYTRQVPRDWINFTSWDPSEINAYPLTISTMYAQNKTFIDHIQSTQDGTQCLICRQEFADWVKAHGGSADVHNLTSTGLNPELVGAENRVIGKHIYKESIRVLTAPAGPLKTFIGLIAVIAMASWDHPAYGTELAQMFTKIPNRLFSALMNIHSGLCFNGQLSISVEGPDDDKSFSWFSPGYTDEFVIDNVIPLVCPFTAQYDQAPFTQPMQDLADVNAASLWISREGFPVFRPQYFNFRPSGTGFKTHTAWVNNDPSKKLDAATGEWWMAYGGSVSEYSSSLQPDQIFTVAYITGNGAFDGSTITVEAGGTGLTQGKRVMYSAKGGNRDALAMTSGISQSTTISMDNLVLGLSWDTMPAGWGVQQKINTPGSLPTDQTANSGNIYVLNGKPPLYDGSVTLGPGIKVDGAHSNAISDIQQTCSFFQIHRYVTFLFNGKLQFGVTTDGKWRDETTAAVQNVQQFLKNQLAAATYPADNPNFILNANPATNPGAGVANWPRDEKGTAITTLRTDGTYDRKTFKVINAWLQSNAYWINTDIWYYAFNHSSWNAYVAAVTGVPVTFKNDTTGGTPGAYAIDDTGTQQKVADWLTGTGTYAGQTTFAKQLVNVGNRAVDDSINKATVRSISCNVADPRVIPGDTIWVNVPGYLGKQTTPPYTNGIYVTTISRSMDLLQSNYTATYSGTRYAADHSQGFIMSAINKNSSFA